MEAPAAIPWPDGTAAASIAAASATRARTPRRLSFWIGVVVFLTFSQGWVMFITGPGGDPSTSGAVRALFFPAYAFALGLALMDWTASARAAIATPLLWLLMGLVLVSSLWSIDPDTTQRRAIALILTTMAGLALAARFDWPELSEVVATGFAVLAAGSLLLAVFVPSWGRMPDLFPGSWRGLWNEKNALGDHMAQAFVVFGAAAMLNPARRLRWTLFAALAVGLIVMSTSKTSLVSVLIGASVLVFVGVVRRGGAVAVLATFFGVTAVIAFGAAAVFAGDKLFRLLGKDPTLTGRTFIWAAVEERIRERPVLGWGYLAVWDDVDRWAPLAKIVKEVKFRPHHAHNSWFEVWLDLGYVGLATWGAYFGEAVLRTIVAIYRSPGAWFAAPFLAVYSFQSLTETMAFTYNDFVWVIFVSIATRLALPRGFGAGAAVEAAVP